MIDVTELRVGNYLRTKEGIIVKIDARTIFDIWDKSDEYSPVELTTDLLPRLAFEKINHICDGVIFKKDWLRLTPIGTSIFADWRGGNIGQIKTLHRLQNLYNDLKEDELTLK